MHHFGRAIRLLDNFSPFGSAVFFLGERRSDPRVVLGDDHNAGFSDSGTSDFVSYMELVLQSRGSEDAAGDHGGSLLFVPRRCRHFGNGDLIRDDRFARVAKHARKQARTRERRSGAD